MQRNQTNEYKLEKNIGEGTYAKVYKAIRKKDQKVVAIKIINVTNMDPIVLKSNINEIRILCSIDNPHVVGYYDSFVDSSATHLWLVMEYMGGGDLSFAIRLAKKEDRKFPENTIWAYMIQILRGLIALNKLKIIHRDIKPANIYLSSDMKVVKIGDMNVAKIAK